jgi:hypothetical protein
MKATLRRLAITQLVLRAAASEIRTYVTKQLSTKSLGRLSKSCTPLSGNE